MLLDSNLIIYAAEPAGDKLRDWLEGQAVSTSVVCRIEVLGFQNFAEPQKTWLSDFFRKVPVHGLDHRVADEAIRLRQHRKIRLADAIIAATAIVHNLPLATHNTEDFKNISGLRVVDPLTM
jgi:predicted nucleic acid-binding protein